MTSNGACGEMTEDSSSVLICDAETAALRGFGRSARDYERKDYQQGIIKMKSVDEIRAIIRQHRDTLEEKYGIGVVGLFGSYARGEQRRGSDIDLLGEILKPISLLELVGAEIYLSEILGTKVELVPKRDVREELRETIARETIGI